MGTPEENLKRVREQVIKLAREIEQMSGQDIPANVFFQEFLNRVVMAIGARAGAVWLLQDGGLTLAAEANLEETGLHELPGATAKNEKLLIDVLQTGEAKTLTPGQEADLPTEHVLVLSALHKEKECVGVVQLFQRTAVPDEARSGYMQFLEQMCGYASRYIEGRRHNSEMTDDLKSEFWTNFEQFTLRIQRSLDEQEVADASASDGRPLLNCDRLSVVTRKGSSVKVRAVSGQSSVNHRANLIVAMARLARRVIDSGETLVYAGKIDNLPPQIEKPLAEFVQESGSRMIMIVPLFENDELVKEQGEEAEQKRRKKKIKAIGCVVVEQVAETEPAPQLEQRAELLADHIGAAVWNSRTHGRIFGKSVFKVVGKGLEWFHGKKLAISTAVLLVIAGIVTAMTLIRLPYPVEADGKLMPIEQHAVWAPWDGKITDIHVKPGEDGVYRVKKGDLLFTVTNPQLEDEIIQARGELQKQQQLLERTAESLRDAPRELKTSLFREQISQLAEVAMAQEQLQRLQDRRKEELTVTAVADGVIPDFKRFEILVNRPVRAGDHLFDIMDESDDPRRWHLELLVEEKRMGHINQARFEQQKETGSDELPAEFTMVSIPESRFRCRLSRIATRSTTDPEMGTAFEMIATPLTDEDEAEAASAAQGRSNNPLKMLTNREYSRFDSSVNRKIGLEVTVRIDCSECTLAYYLFGDVVEFVQREMWWF